MSGLLTLCMDKILITGATGNIGKALIDKLLQLPVLNYKVVAGIRSVTDAQLLPQHPQLSIVPFDFSDSQTFQTALQNVSIVFLLRPPQISDVSIFESLINAMQSAKVKQLVFLSVQGVEQSSVIPHHKIEKLITASGLQYIFLRPGYFMQNLTTTLYPEIKEARSVSLPAGNAAFNWVDVHNIAEVGAQVLTRFSQYANSALEITGTEQLSFSQAIAALNKTLHTHISYRSVNPLKFYFLKRKAGLPGAFILVMIALHFLPRFQKPKPLAHTYQQITGRQPTTLHNFFKREADLFR